MTVTVEGPGVVIQSQPMTQHLQQDPLQRFLALFHDLIAYAKQTLAARTPKDTGYMSRKWKIQAVGADPVFGPERLPQSFRLGDGVQIVNTAPYAGAIEGGWSWQAPDGVLGPASRQITAWYNAELRRRFPGN